MLEFVLYPKKIAVIGASSSPTKVGQAIISNILKCGFEGEVVLINPEAGGFDGLKCYKSLKDYKEKIDLAVVDVPADLTKDAVRDCIKASAKSVCVLTSGFKEIGPEGEKLEQCIVNMCRSSNVRLLGPNVVGIINTHHKLNATYGTQMPREGGISLISQSGAICTVLLEWVHGRKIGLATLISIGNKGDLNEVDFLDAFTEDENTKVIICYLADIQNGEAFIKAAKTAASKKPVVVLKAGVSDAGAKAAHSHTGSMAGADIAYGAAFRRSGIIRANSVAQLLDFGIAFEMQPLPDGDNVAIITNGGGLGTAAADAIIDSGLNVDPFSDETVNALKTKLPNVSAICNPVNTRMSGPAEFYLDALNIFQDDPRINAILCMCAPQAVTPPEVIADIIINNSRGEKPILAVFMGDETMRDAREKLISNNIPIYGAPQSAAASLKAMRDYAKWKERPPRIVTRFPVNRQRVERIISRHLKMGRTQIAEVEAKEILKAYDFTVPEGMVAKDATEAIDAAERIGYPVAMKIISSDIIHKSDFGGVKLNLTNSEEVEDAYDFMMLRVKRKAPDAKIDGVYVEKMCLRGMEVILGMNRDPQFGPMLMFGHGGIFVEVMDDVTFHLAPITADEAMQMMKSTRSYALMKSTRGESAVDLNSIAVGLQRISQLVTDFPEIQELDINPFIAGGIGVEPFVADARMTLIDKGSST